MGFRRALPIFLLAVVSAAPARGQSYLVHTYTENDGLPSSMVYDLAQAPDGLLWFATRSGIAAYDGRTWRLFGAAEGLAGDVYSHIAVDDRGTVWALARSPRASVSRFDDGRWSLLPFPPLSAETGGATVFAVSRPGGEIRVAIGTFAGGVLVFDGEGWASAAISENRPGPAVTGLIADHGGFLVATRAGLVRLEEGKAAPLTRGADGRGAPLLGLVADRAAGGDRFWLLGAGNLSLWGPGGLTTAVADAPSPATPIFPFLFGASDGRGGLVYGNPEGLFHYAEAEGLVRRLGAAAGLIAEGGTGLLRDREGNVWISGLRGVSKIVSFRFTNYQAMHGLLENEVTAIVESAPGRFVFGHGTGLTFFDGREFTTRAFAPAGSRDGFGATETRIQELCAGRDGTVWIAASSLGLGRISGNGAIRWYREREGVKSARTVAVDAAGRICLIDDDGLKVMRNDRFVPYPYTAPLTGRRVVADPDGSLWLAHFTQGLIQVAGAEIRRFKSPDNPEADNVYSVRRDSRGVLWVGTRAGLRVVSGDSIGGFRAAGFSLDRPVYSILEDRRGRMWFGTDNGVVLWDGAKARTFTRRQGFVGQETNRGAAITDHEGRVWIGTDLGLSRFDEAFDVAPDKLPPPFVSLLGVETERGFLALGSAPLTLPSGLNTLTFRFRGVSFIDEQALRFRCRLEGFDEGWSPPFGPARPEARYTNLPRGRYTFYVEASNAPDVWSPAVVSAPLLIRGPFWRTWWFIALCVLGAGLMLQVGLSAVAERRRARVLEAKVLERTGELRASLAEKEVLLREIHHRVKNNLQVVASLLYLQARGVPEPVRQLFEESRERLKTMALIHETLYRSSDLTRIEVPGYFKTLAEAVFKTLGAERVAVRLDLKLAPTTLQTELAVTCGLILNELLTNALKYAFPGGRGGTVGIEFEEQPAGAYRFVVWDDGRGLPPGLDVRTSETLGLKLVDGLVRQLGGTIDVASAPGARFTIRFGRP